MIIQKEQFAHYIKYQSEYHSTYNYDCNPNFTNILTGELHNNTYVNELYITLKNYGRVSRCEKAEFIKKIIKMRNWKSIYVNTYSASVLDALSSQQNSNLVRLQLSSINLSGDKFLKLVQNSHFLEYFEANLKDSECEHRHKISQAIRESNIKTLIFNNFSIQHMDLKFMDNIINSKIRNFHLTSCKFYNEFNLINNYTILNFTVNYICPDYAQNILKRNKQYILTILLCMNRKIIPRCVFKSMILNEFI